MKTLAIVGASLAGLSAARAAREQGFDGEIKIIGEEEHRPYDRPPLSKAFLNGTMTEDDLSLENPSEDLNLTWMLGRRALELDPNELRIWLDQGEEVKADYILIATGASPRRLPISGAELEGIHYLRTLDDALALKKDLKPGNRMVVVGSGWIGAEIASTAKNLGLDVTVLEVGSTPLAGPLGVTMGGIIGSLHEKNGVNLRTGVTVDHFEGEDGRLTGVELADSEFIPANVVVIGIGATPNVRWLEESGLDLSNGVICDKVGQTNRPGIAAVGDCAAWMDVAYGLHRRIEHWTGALERPAVAIANLLGTGAETKPVAPPYFWSEQYGLRLQFAGASSSADRISWEEGNEASEAFVVVYWEGDEPIGVLGAGLPRPFTKWRKTIAAKDIEWCNKNS